jgi:hypothetical protein
MNIVILSDNEAELHYPNERIVTISAPNVAKFLEWWNAKTHLTYEDWLYAELCESEETCDIILPAA